MSVVTTADNLIERIKNRVTAPVNQSRFDEADMLQFFDDVIRLDLASLTKQVRQDYLVYTLDVATVEDQEAYDMPPRAMGWALRDAKLRNGTTGTLVNDLILIAPEDEHLYRTGGNPKGFFFRNDQIILRPYPSTDDLIVELSFHQTLSKMVMLDAACKVTSVASPVVNVDAVPATWAVGDSVDMIFRNAGHRLLKIDAVITDLAATSLTFAAADIPAELAAGDYISLAGTSPLYPLPEVSSALAVTLAAIRLMKAQGDFEAAAELEKDEAKEKKAYVQVITPRITGESTKIINRHGLLRAGRGRRGFIP
jgi:hypothetical protein